jgi:hypothetical protein
LKQKLELSEDENMALKVTVEATTEAKSRDYKMFTRLLDQARSEIEESYE